MALRASPTVVCCWPLWLQREQAPASSRGAGRKRKAPGAAPPTAEQVAADVSELGRGARRGRPRKEPQEEVPAAAAAQVGLLGWMHGGSLGQGLAQRWGIFGAGLALRKEAREEVPAAAQVGLLG